MSVLVSENHRTDKDVIMNKAKLFALINSGLASVEGVLNSAHLDDLLNAFGRKALSPGMRGIVDGIIAGNQGGRACVACRIALHLIVHEAVQSLVTSITTAVVGGEIVGEAAVDTAVLAGEAVADAGVVGGEAATAVGVAAIPATIAAEVVAEAVADTAGLGAEAVTDLATAVVVNAVLTRVEGRIEQAHLVGEVINQLCQRVHACSGATHPASAAVASTSTAQPKDRRSLFSTRLVDAKGLSCEADTIVSAVILGFAGTRFQQKQPCRFDIEHPGPEAYENPDAPVGERRMKKIVEQDRIRDLEAEFLAEYQDFLNVLSAMSQVLDLTDRRVGDHLRDGQSPEGRPGELITGRRGGATREPQDRALEITSEQARKIQEQIRRQEDTGHDLYEGRGAYTGLVSDPDHDRLYVESTRRVIDRDPTRWHPGTAFTNWGLINAVDGKTGELINLRSDKNGLGPLPTGVSLAGARVGYIHGMCLAVQKCCEWGPNCTPFEVATGTQTTKMASCFPCTTYMYATNYPPSSIHLGRGESWVPPSNAYANGQVKAKRDFAEPGVGTALEQWNRDIFAYLSLGAKYLAKAAQVQRAGGQISFAPDHLPAITALGIWINAHARQPGWISTHGGRLFLDALTVHESEWKRAKSLLAPLVAELTLKTTSASAH